MVRLFIVFLLGSSMAFAQSSTAGNDAQQNAIPANRAAAAPDSLPGPLPPEPPGKSTVLGGAIRNVDPVRDQFMLKVFGGGPVKILFDERTQLYRDGVRIPILDLRAQDHASVETTLDGTNIFALKIHILSQLPQGECSGQVLSYNPRTGELTVGAALTREPITLRVPAGTPVVRVGQDAFKGAQGGAANLMRGALVDVTFEAGKRGEGVATHIDVLATPGSEFVFQGNISFLDAHSGRLVIVNSGDSQSYQVAFTPSLFPVSRELHQGSHVKVTAKFDGSQYVATAISME